MVIRFESIEDLCSEKVDIYTVRIDDKSLFEYEEFYNKSFPNHEEEIHFIDNALEEIKKRGALRYYFRHEGPADALPQNVPNRIVELNPDDLGIRLYCIRLADNVLILLNGDIKTRQNPKECPNVRTHFLFANKLATCLTTYILENRINLFEDRNCFHTIEIEL